VKVTKRHPDKPPAIETIPNYSRPHCDRCGVSTEAKYRVAVGKDGILDFCNHHFQRFVTKFIELGYHWINFEDERKATSGNH
jgi:hypothetical protein